LLLLGCSAPIHGAIEHLSDSVELHCGWARQQVTPPASECVVYVVDGDDPRLLLDDADPCELAPVAELRVDAGRVMTQWGHLGSESAVVYDEPCHN
jgi:hypothetical protein